LLAEKEMVWLDVLSEGMGSIPTDESKFIDEMLPTLDKSKIIISEYGL
jgi:hypothetical protein